MNKARREPTRLRHRAGLTTPAVALAMLIAMIGLALILDRLWLEAASVELTTAAEAASLAAARTVVSDELLQQSPDFNALYPLARKRASDIAALNPISGETVALATSEGRDIQFGHQVVTSDGSQFEETQGWSSQVLVTAHRTRSRNNPVALVLRTMSGRSTTDLTRQASASWDNHVVGIRPYEGTLAPFWPLAIRLISPPKQPLTGWKEAIEDRLGKDDYSFDEETGRVFRSPDGISEMTLKTQGKTSSNSNSKELPNLYVVNLGTNFSDHLLGDQFERGLSHHDLSDWDGELSLGTADSPSSTPVELHGTPRLLSREVNELERQIGQARMCLLFNSDEPGHSKDVSTLKCVSLVAMRLLKVSTDSEGRVVIKIQPTVITTKTAVLGTGEAAANPYVYKIQLTQ